MEGLGFEKVAPYLSDPLVLIGFVLMLFYGLVKTLATNKILTPVSGRASADIVKSVLRYGFWLSLLVIALGFGLKYRELSHKEQANAVGLMQREFSANLATIDALRQNTVTLMEISTDVAKSLREPNIRVYATLFPLENVQVRPSTPAPGDLAIDALKSLLAQRLEQNKTELAKGDEAAKVLRGTIDRTRATIVSLGDASGSRYQILDAAYQSSLPMLSKVVSVEGVPQLQNSYPAARKLRADYNVVQASVLAYLDSLHDVLSLHPGVTLPSMQAALTQERQTFALLTTYGNSLANEMAKLKSLEAELQRKI